MGRSTIIGILLAAALTAVALTGCSNAKPKFEEVAITVLVDDQGASALGSQVNTLLDKSKTFVEQENPGLIVNLVRVPHDQYADKIIELKPDIYWALPYELTKPQNAGKLYDLNPLLEQANVDITQYFPSSLLDMATVDGKLLGIPLTANHMAVAYSKSWYGNAGLAEPSPNWTWEQFESDAIALKEANGADSTTVYGASFPLYSEYIESIVLSRGGSFLSPDGKQTSGYMDGPVTVGTMAWLKGLADSGALDPDSTGDLSQIGTTTGMVVSATPIINSFMSANADIGIVPLPSINGDYIVSAPYVTMFNINSSSLNPEAALKYIIALTMEDNEITREALRIGMSISKKVFDNSGADVNPSLALDYQLLPYSQQRAVMQSSGWGEAMGYYSNHFMLMMQEDVSELVPTLQDMAQGIDAKLAELRAKDEEEAAAAAVGETTADTSE
ncbi:ABC transporter substrate-binding protein [Cohnella panacarvi]|uniref:ABC transporter substrate-binding protein n=1 Tax=Cohnella panacarvi TaxID=400776 RepID=UPI000478F430|nr:extracellular solute-binding protein [Cohnella panacarvi]